MSKKRKSRKSSFFGRFSRSSPDIDLRQTLSEAEKLIDSGNPREAIEFLTPLAQAYPREAQIHHVLGTACLAANDVWGALDSFEQAQLITRNPVYWQMFVPLRLRGLLAEATVDDKLWVVIPADLRAPLAEILAEITG